MKTTGFIALLLLLGGCGIADDRALVDIRTLVQCAERYPPPPQANVERLGLIPVYVTRTTASDDAAVQRWFREMDACAQPTKPVSAEKSK